MNGPAKASFWSVLLQLSLYKGLFYPPYQTASQCSLWSYTLYQSIIPPGFVSPRGFSLKAADDVAKDQCAQSITRRAEDWPIVKVRRKVITKKRLVTRGEMQCRGKERLVLSLRETVWARVVLTALCRSGPGDEITGTSPTEEKRNGCSASCKSS